MILVVFAKILILLYEFSIQECQCFPWNFPKPVENKKFPMCTFYGNHCFNSKFQNLTYRTEQCECLPGCNRINYKFQVDSVEKFSEKQIETFCPDYQVTPVCDFMVINMTENFRLTDCSQLGVTNHLLIQIFREMEFVMMSITINLATGTEETVAWNTLIRVIVLNVFA